MGRRPIATVDPSRYEPALDWVRRLHDPDFSDWDAHIAWLEQSRGNARAFDAALLDIEAATRGLSPDPAPRAVAAMPANDVAPRRWWRPLTMTGGALAAGIVGAIALWSGAPTGERPYDVRTTAGEMRSIALPDGTRIALNGDTLLRLDRAAPRRAELVHGEALFTVVHDARQPFAVQVGAGEVQDVGTVFDVALTGDRTTIGVREGAVLYDPAGPGVRLAAGDVLHVDGTATARLRHVDAAAIGGWRDGRLTYTQAPMSDVADDLSRATGSRFTVDPVAADRPFSGVIGLDGDRIGLARRVAAVTGLSVRRDGTGWRIALPDR